jgi:hypothetical protein
VSRLQGHNRNAAAAAFARERRPPGGPLVSGPQICSLPGALAAPSPAEFVGPCRRLPTCPCPPLPSPRRHPAPPRQPCSLLRSRWTPAAALYMIGRPATSQTTASGSTWSATRAGTSCSEPRLGQGARVRRAGEARGGVAWRGVAWRGVAWRGVAWRGVGVGWGGVGWGGLGWAGPDGPGWPLPGGPGNSDAAAPQRNLPSRPFCAHAHSPDAHPTLPFPAPSKADTFLHGAQRHAAPRSRARRTAKAAGASPLMAVCGGRLGTLGVPR